MYIDRAHERLAFDGTLDPIQHYIKLHVGTASLGVLISDRLYPVVGEGGSLTVEVGPEGSLVTVSLEARRIVGCRNDPLCKQAWSLMDPSVARIQAEAEALKMGVKFHEPSLTWGYFEAPASCYQREMGIVYRFTFKPLPEESVGPIVVDIPAQQGVERWVCFGDQVPMARADLPPGCVLGTQQ
jgi:hypothetical protein